MWTSITLKINGLYELSQKELYLIKIFPVEVRVNGFETTIPGYRKGTINWTAEGRSQVSCCWSCEVIGK